MLSVGNSSNMRLANSRRNGSKARSHLTSPGKSPCTAYNAALLQVGHSLQEGWREGARVRCRPERAGRGPGAANSRTNKSQAAHLQ